MFDLQVTRSEKAWRKWFDTDAPEEEHMPDGTTFIHKVVCLST
jgi:heme-degrading monooxygenase HmoA